MQQLSNEEEKQRNTSKYQQSANNDGGEPPLNTDPTSRTTSQINDNQYKNQYLGMKSQATDQSKVSNNSTVKTQASTTQMQSSVSNQKMSAIDRLKQVQNIFKQTWQGIHTEFTGRPGTSIICNKKRTFVKPEQMKNEEERAIQFEAIFSLLQNIENDNIPLLIGSG